MGRFFRSIAAATGFSLSLATPLAAAAAEEAATAPQAAPKLELIDPPPMPLPSAFSTKGQRPKSNPTVLPPAATKLDPALQRLAAPATMALPDKTDQVKIVELRPLSLQDVENLAEVNNPNLKAIASRVDQAQSNLRATIAAWYPSFNFTTTNAFPSWRYGRAY
ncbi:MAG: TolC family protein, partial [Vulcanococcus sp.]